MLGLVFCIWQRLWIRLGEYNYIFNMLFMLLLLLASAAYGQQSATSAPNTLSYHDKTYKTIKIGNQIWMAENLNFDATGSKCYDNNQANCNTYGRLYKWATAMALPDSCNSKPCKNQIKANHRGICPEGWHIPDSTDWQKLVDFAGGSLVAGKKLRAKSGWNSGGNGTDDYGFSALPGGQIYGNGTFGAIGNFGYFWSVAEAGASARILSLNYGMTGTTFLLYSKANSYSVRCIQSPPPPPPIHYDTLFYQGQVYRIIKIGTQTWMADNLNYNVSGSICYNNDLSKCKSYGRLYNWEAAMALPSRRGVCPEGWRIPSNADWQKLIDFTGGDKVAGKTLKAKDGWSSGGNGTDDYGFSALPGGHSPSLSDSGFGYAGSLGYWWSADKYDAKLAHTWHMSYYYSNAYSDVNYKTRLFSIRCMKE